MTRINSTLPGAVSAVIDDNIKGETGDVVLLDKGSKVFGTIQKALMNGADRLGVLWQNITTPVLYDGRGMPHQFRVTANSPASSELGETGLDGDVNRHLGRKIGGIIGMSLVQGGIQAGVQAASQNRGQQTNLNFVQNSGNSASEELLRAWVQIPDVMTRDQGLTCGIQLVRDLDMHGAYTLHVQNPMLARS
jgi:type IV secretion system protein VirB10